MAHAHAIVWLDHQHGTVIDYSLDDTHVVKVETPERRKLHRKSGPMGSGKAPEDLHFYDEIVAAVGDAREVLVCGPGTAKTAFMHHVERKHRGMAKRIVGVETLDHPTDPELVAFAKRYFKKVDALLGDT